MNYNEFAEQVKKKYPAYANVDNKTLAEKMVAKYPVYKEQVSFDDEPTKPQPLKVQTENEQPDYQADLQDAAREAAAQYGGIPANNGYGNFEQENKTTPTLQGNVEKKVRQELDSKGRVHYIDENGNEINNKLPLMQRIGRGIKAKFTPQYKPIDEKTKDAWQIAKFLGGLATRSPQGFAAVEGLGSFVDDWLEGNKPNAGKAAITGAATYGGAKGLELAVKSPLGQKAIQKGSEFISNKVAPAAKGAIAYIKKGFDSIKNKKVSPKNNAANETVAAEVQHIDDINPTITKSEDLKNITKKSVKDAKKEFKTEISKEFNEKGNLNNSMTTNKSKKGFYKTVSDPVGYDMEVTAREVNDILKEIKNNPEIVNDSNKMADLENRLNKSLEKWTNTDFANFAEEQGSKYWNAIVEAEKFAKTSKDYATLAGRNVKERGAIKTIEKKINSDVANAVTDKEYLTRGLEVNKLQLEQMAPEEVQKLINSEDISDLSITARALDINKDIESGKIPLYKLNKWASEGTPIGQAMQARSLLNLSTPQGALAKMVSVINEAAPKVVKNLKKATKEILDNVNAAQSAEEVEKGLQRTITNKKQRKTFAEKLLKLKEAGELSEESFTRLVDKHYKLPEITEVDLKKVNELTSNLQKATDDYDKKVAEGLLSKYIADKVPKKMWDKVNSYRYQNMLLSTKSRVKDALLTGINTADTAIDESIASVIDAARSKITGSDRVINGLHPKEWFNGLKKGLKEGANDVKLGINTSRSGERARYGLPNSYSFDFKPVMSAKWESITNNPIANALNNALAGGERALNYSIRVPDRMFYEGRYASSLADQLEAAGLKEPTEDIIEQAVKEAREAVYQDDSWVNKLGLLVRKGLNMPSKAINNFTDKNFVPNIGDWVEPFVTTPANIANQGLKNTFGGVPAAIKLATNKNLLPGEIRDAEILLAKNIKGIAPILAGIAIGKGAIESNIGNNNFADNEVSGLKPQSIVIGDKAISLKDYPQMSIPMAFGKGLSDGGVTQGVLNAGKAVTDMSSLKSIGDLVGTLQSGRQDELEPKEILDNIVRNQGVNAISQLIPFGGALGEIRNDIDPYARELYTENTPEYVKNRLQNRIPFASKALPEKYNAVGEPVMANNIENPVLRALSEGIDIGIRNKKKNETYENINKFADEIKDTDIKGRTTVGLQKSKRTIKVNGENVKLNNKQYSNYQKEYGKLNYVLKKQALNSERYKTASNEERAEYLTELRRSIEEAVKIKQFGHKPNRTKKKYTDEILSIYDDLLKE